jgi:hypothetical protein
MRTLCGHTTRTHIVACGSIHIPSYAAIYDDISLCGHYAGTLRGQHIVVCGNKCCIQHIRYQAHRTYADTMRTHMRTHIVVCGSIHVVYTALCIRLIGVCGHYAGTYIVACGSTAYVSIRQRTHTSAYVSIRSIYDVL